MKRKEHRKFLCCAMCLLQELYVLTGGGEVKGGTGSSDLGNFSAKSTDSELVKVKSETTKGLAEND